MILFIGGSHDGERREIDPERWQVCVPVKESFKMRHITVETIPADIFKYEIYTRQTYSGQNKQFSVFVFEKLNPDDVLALLIEKYKP